MDQKQYDKLKAKATRSPEEDAVVAAFDAVKEAKDAGEPVSQELKDALVDAQEALRITPSTTE